MHKDHWSYDRAVRDNHFGHRDHEVASAQQPTTESREPTTFSGLVPLELGDVVHCEQPANSFARLRAIEQDFMQRGVFVRDVALCLPIRDSDRK